LRSYVRFVPPQPKNINKKVLERGLSFWFILMIRIWWEFIYLIFSSFKN